MFVGSEGLGECMGVTIRSWCFSRHITQLKKIFGIATPSRRLCLLALGNFYSAVERGGRKNRTKNSTLRKTRKLPRPCLLGFETVWERSSNRRCMGTYSFSQPTATLLAHTRRYSSPKDCGGNAAASSSRQERVSAFFRIS